MASIRRSSRSRKVNTKYTNDILDEEAKHFLTPVPDSPSSALVPESEEGERDAESSESEFEAPVVGEDDAEGDDDDEDLTMASDGARRLSEGSPVQTPVESDDEIVSVGTDYDSDGRRVKARRVRLSRVVDTEETHSRGLSGGLSTHTGKEEGWNMLFGPAHDDMLPIVYIRDLWLGTEDVTLPTRRTLRKTIASGHYGKSNRCGVPEAELRLEATTGWDWYYGEKGMRLKKTQQLQEIHDESEKRTFFPKQASHGVFLGPGQEQQKYTIDCGGCIGLGSVDSIGPEEATHMDVDSTNGPANDGSNPEPVRARISLGRNGWLLNVGSKIQGVAWAPNCEGRTQYLAVAAATTSVQRSSFEGSKSAFIASPPYPSCIQIWSFAAVTEPDQPSKLNMSTSSKLRQVLCTNWGNIRQLSWCPVLHEKRAEPSDGSDEVSIGMLACTSSDGAVRILDVRIHDETLVVTQYLHVSSAAFTIAPPPRTPIYTTMEWLSSSDVAVANASGSVSLFSIASHYGNTKAMDSESYSPKPYYTLPITPSATYILQMSSCYPSPTPGYLALTSVSGEATLMSLVQSHVDTVNAMRLRLPASALTYLPSMRGHLASQEDFLYFHPTRRFFSGVIVGRAAASGIITCHAVSRWHPLAIFGTSSGEVISSNVLRRVLPGGRKYGGGGHWQQRVLKYDWIADEVPVGSSKGTLPSDTGLRDSVFDIRDVRPGLSRFHEGFRPERVEMSRGSAGRFAGRAKPKETAAIRQHVDTGMETIFEEENAVTAVAWNANLCCAGWVAMGFGSGLIRVEDVAWE